MKTLVLSDLHLGSPLFDKESEVFNLLRSDDYERIILNGDIFDIWEDDFYDIIRKNTFLATTILNTSSVKDVYYIKGNHDENLEIIKDAFPDIKICKDLQIGEFFIIHGDEFDDLVTKYSLLSKILFIPHWLAQRIFGINIKSFFRNLFHSISNKKNKKYYSELVDDIDKEAVETYKQRCNYLILGHTHFPKILEFEDCVYINSGDMISNYTYVEFDETENTYSLHEVK